ncbi:MAG: hypothetical protein K8H88_04705 [Sandaracinaceae bacterium]|nr:hypothetical protein [Sandaracinaceae bacterium]
MTGRKRTALGADALDALISPVREHHEQQEEASSSSAMFAPEDAGETAEMQGPRSPGRPRGKGFGVQKGTRWRRSDGEEMRARSIQLPTALDKRLRERAAKDDKHITAVVIEALEAYLR